MKRLMLSVVFVVTAMPSFAQIPQEEREALIALYNSTDGANWNDSFGWLGGVGTECGWFGVSCEGGHVQDLWMHSVGLNGTIPPELGNLSRLEILTLNLNQLTGRIPPELGSLSELKQLEMFSNQLTGSIPPELGNLLSLEILYLQGNELTGIIPLELGNLSSLDRLWLRDNQLSGSIPPELGNLSSLSRLILDTNQLTGSIPPELGNLSSLEILWLFSNQLSGTIPPELANISTLNQLALRSNQLAGSIPLELGNLLNLRVLSLYDNQLNGNIPQELGNLSSLESLRLHSNQLVGVVPASLTNLTALLPDKVNLSYNGLYTDNETLQAFLNSKDPDWNETQTIAPININATPAASASVDLTWTPILFTDFTGGYRIYVADNAGGPYTLFGETTDKTTSSMTVDGLAPGNNHHFYLQAVTYSGTHNTNTVVSDPSEVLVMQGNCSLVVTSPNGGEVWVRGEEVNITWTAEGDGCADTVRIDLNRAGVFDQLIINSVNNGGAFQWTVPSSILDGNNYQVGISDSDDQSISDVSDGFFSIGSGIRWWPAAPKEQQAVRLAYTSAGSPIRWDWSFGDGATSSEKNPSHIYSSPGMYSVDLTVDYPNGRAYRPAMIRVVAGPPECGDTICEADETAWNCPVDCGLPEEDSGRTGGAGMKSLLPAAVGGIRGVGDTFWLTEGMFFNPNDRITTYVVEFIKNDEPTTVLQAGPFSLEPETSNYHENLIEELFDIPDGGSIWVDSAEPLILNTRTYNQTDNGTFGQGVSAIGKKMALGDGDGPVYLPGISENEQFRSNIFIQEAGIAPVTVTITVYLSDGTSIDSTTKDIALHGRFEGRFRSSALFPGLELSQGYATVEVEGEGQTVTIASVVDEITGDATTIDAVHAQQVLGSSKKNLDRTSGQHLLVAVVARIPGLENTLWRSDLTILSPVASGAEQEIALDYRQTGATVAQTVTITLMPGEQLSLTDVIGELWPAAGDGAGSLHITALLGVIVSTRTYNLRSDNGTLGQAIPGLAGGEVARSGEVWILDLLKNNDDYRCNIGFSEYSGEDAQVKITLYDMSGSAMMFLASKTYDVRAFANAQVNQIFENMGIEGNFRGTIAYAQVISDSGAVYFYASVIDNITGDANAIIAKRR